MNYRQKCKQKGAWMFFKFKQNVAIYAACQNCGCTLYHCSRPDIEQDQYGNIKFIGVERDPYRFCPNCGLKMHLYNGNYIYRETDNGFELWNNGVG